jgi:hypothetical protein
LSTNFLFIQMIPILESYKRSIKLYAEHLKLIGSKFPETQEIQESKDFISKANEENKKKEN